MKPVSNVAILGVIPKLKGTVGKILMRNVDEPTKPIDGSLRMSG